VGELEDTIARQLAVLRELEEMRQAATDPRTKQYLRTQECQARKVHAWLCELRAEMRGGPRD
jgi:hypothetical protein